MGEGLKRLLIIVIWIVISIGIYQCSKNMGENGENSTDNDTNEESVDIPKEEDTELSFGDNVRILIMTDDYKSIYHSEIKIDCSEGIITEINGKISEYEAGTDYVLKADELQKNDIIKIKGKNQSAVSLKNINRSADVKYRGTLECHSANDGIVIINELPVEEYLYGVVPSEMPSSYPLEALKAQAVSARTYTYFHMKNYAYPEWKAHMDDSTSYQVYMNCGETADTCKAVDETKNQVLTYNGELVESFYYSTSGGFNGGAAVWSDKITDEYGYLKETGEELYGSNTEKGEKAYMEYIDSGDVSDVDYSEAWYRWNYEKDLEEDTVKILLKKLYDLSVSQPDKVKVRSQYLSADKLETEKAIKDIRILNRRKSGLVTGIMIETENFRVSVMSQHVIRQVLGCLGGNVTKNDGTDFSMSGIFPSAYFYIQKIYDNNGENGDTLKKIIIHGAGLGHGCGMSQNGAKNLADRGLTFEQILSYYYNGSLRTIGELGGSQ